MGADYTHHIGLDSNKKKSLVVPLLPLGATKQCIDSALDQVSTKLGY
jgi:hypothetical protein